MDFLIAGLGLVVLLLAGDALVKGAVNISLRLGIPAVIVGLTVVAFGTSAPELVVAIQSVMLGVPTIAMGNVVGSNTANILLVLGLPALLTAIPPGGGEARRNFVVMIGASLAFITLSMFGPFGWLHGLILLAMLAVFLADNYLAAQRHRAANGAPALVPEEEAEELEGVDPSMPVWRLLLLLALGVVGLPVGADLFVDGASAIARSFGISEAVIGLTLVAVGTSLPELATTLIAAIRREDGVALGNVIGSNIFNLLGIIGVASLFGQIPVAPEFLQLDLWVMLAASLALGPFLFLRRPLGRGWGILFVAAYVVYVWILLV